MEDSMASCAKRARLSSTPTDEDEGRTHPLLIDHVLEKILEYVGKQPDRKKSKSEVLRCREVCKDWSQMGLKVFKKLYPTYDSFSPKDANQLETFVKVWSKADDLIYKNYSFVSSLILENSQVFLRFLKEFGPAIQNLELRFEQQLNVFFDHFSFQEVDLSNLKSFRIYFGFCCCAHFASWEPTQSQSTSKEFREGVDFFEAILKSSANLHRFAFENCFSYITSKELNGILVNLVIPNLSKNVQELTITVTIVDDTLRKLQNLGLRLTAFAIYLIGSSLTIECLMEFIETQKNSLIQLTIEDRRNEEVNIYECPFPICHKLKVLEIRWAKGSTFSCIKAFPSLETLHFEGCFWLNDSNMLLDSPHTSLKDLGIEFKIADSMLITKLAKSFPQLKKLKINLQSKKQWTEMVPTVSNEMPNLENLLITYLPDVQHPFFPSYKRVGYSEHKFGSCWEHVGNTMVYHECQPPS